MIRTEEEIRKKIKSLQEVNTTMANGKTDVLMEFKRAMSITALLYVLGLQNDIYIEEVVNGDN